MAPERSFEAQRADELVTLLAGHSGPVLLVAPDVPALRVSLADDARDDLAAGVTLAFAPAGDGHPFLLMLATPDPELLARAGAPFEYPAGLAESADASLGMLRAERRLATLADARAWRADPLCPPELRSLLAAIA